MAKPLVAWFLHSTNQLLRTLSVKIEGPQSLFFRCPLWFPQPNHKCTEPHNTRAIYIYIQLYPNSYEHQQLLGMRISANFTLIPKAERDPQVKDLYHGSLSLFLQTKKESVQPPRLAASLAAPRAWRSAPRCPVRLRRQGPGISLMGQNQWNPVLG